MEKTKRSGTLFCAPDLLHNVLLRAVINHPKPHLTRVGHREFCNACLVKGRAEPCFRIETEIIRKLLLILFHTITSFIGCPEMKK